MRKSDVFVLCSIILLATLGMLVYVKQIPKTPFGSHPTQQPNHASVTTRMDIPRVQVIATNLEVPWAIGFLPDTSMLITERPGRVRMIYASGILDPNPLMTFSDVVTQTAQYGENGLLGLAIHPNFTKNHFVYFYYTYADTNGNTKNRVVRYTFANKQFANRKVIVDAIPGNVRHDGGRITFGPDGYLYITTGDSLQPSLAQDTTALAGKILRVTDDGSPAPGNPFKNDVYSYGHRNPQGLAWDTSGQLYEVEHGDTAHDEINKIQMGANYGWPTIQGDQTKPGMVTPLKNSENITWAPGDMAYVADGIFYFAALKDEALYKAAIQNGSVSLTPYFSGELGRIREVIKGPDGMLYITTSNRDGRATPRTTDDQIIRVNPAKL